MRTESPELPEQVSGQTVTSAVIPPTYREVDVKAQDVAFWVQSQGRAVFGTIALFAVVARTHGVTRTMASQCEIHAAIHIVNALRAYGQAA